MRLINNVFKYTFFLLRTLNPFKLSYDLYKDREKILVRLKMLIREFPTEPVELFCALAMLGWGIFFLTPFSRTEASLSVTTFIGNLLPLWVWGIILTYIGLAQTHALLTDCDSGRKHTSFVASLFWMFLSIGYFVTSLPPSTVIYILLIVANAWVYLRIGKIKSTVKSEFFK